MKKRRDYTHNAARNCGFFWHHKCSINQQKYLNILEFMPLRKRITLLMIAASAVVLCGDMSEPTITILGPAATDSVSYDQGKLLLVSALKTAAPTVTLSAQWKKIEPFSLALEDSRSTFLKDFYKFFDPQATIEQVTYSLKMFKSYTKPETLSYAYADTISIRSFWKKPELLAFMKAVQSTNATEVFVTAQGWKDTTYEAVYDDPSNDLRTLYKMHLQLIPGVNNIFIAPAGVKENAFRYTTSMVADSKPTADRPTRFHLSELEQSCTTCHEGLPSADNGVTMSADCNVCHKAKTGANYLHAPSEMKECGSCHTWSAEQKAVVVEKGVPGACYTCHEAKQAQVESSAYPHPVASECMTCHSSHGTDQKHLLKNDVYSLCTSCHEEQKINHPVGRHPLRFVKIPNGEEISCATCHNPHGSPNARLFPLPVDRMELCSACHG